MHIDRLAAQDASRTYLQNADVARSGAAEAHAKHAESAARRQAESRTTDSVTLSDNAKSLAAAREVVANAPDVRGEKVAEIKQRVSDGTYNVPAHVLARNLLNPTEKPTA